MRTRLQIVDVEPDVLLVHGPHVNWVILREGSALTLIDAGYPSDAPAVVESLRAVGERTGATDLRAVLVTHGHSDHIGGLAHVVAAADGDPEVLTAADEVGHVRRDYLHQVTLGQVLRHGNDPRVLRWAAAAVRAGGLRAVGYPEVRPHAQGAALDLPGRPVPRATPGHTLGHTSYEIPRLGLVITGDALITGHGTSRVRGPQQLAPVFHTDPVLAASTFHALAALEPGTRVLTGHGPLGVVGLDAR